MSQLEKKILEKVRPLKPEKGYYSGNTTVIQSTDLTQLPHNHQKGKQCRSCRTLRKIAREEKEREIASQAIQTAREASIGIGTALVFGGLEILKEGVAGILKVEA